MITELKTRPAADRYQADFYVWALAQADLLKAKQFDALDLESLIDEVEGLADTKKNAIERNAGAIVEYLLKLAHSPARDPRRGWAETIVEHRSRLETDLTPRLRQLLEEDLPRVYDLTRRTTARKLRLCGEDSAADALPLTCPYTVPQILDDWWPES